ncbi:MAG TPA: phosphoribosylglycinamide formyltransferase [Frankiaceae bacterium]|nr:phosphoribosylglycinamide formyltransferase [Frankiaceae bacterium]
MPARLVVLASGAGTTLQAILDACRAPSFGADVVAVGTDRPGTRAEARAAEAGVPTWIVPLSDFASRSDFDRAVAGRLAEDRPDLVVLAGYMKVLGPEVVREFRIVNTHPSLLPAFPGGHAIRDALAYGVRVTGCTVHEVDEGVDTGPVLAQAPVPVLPDDTEDMLRARIQAVERGLYVETIGRLVDQLAGRVPAVVAVPGDEAGERSPEGRT